MKKIIYMLMAAGMLAACENPLEYKPENRADELIVNALLDASQTGHTVVVAVSSTEYIRNVNSATLRCFVNGRQVATSSEPVDSFYPYEGRGSSLEFSASFKAGDLVRIEVDAEGKFSAWCEQTVPEPAIINRVDTVRIDEVSYRFDINISDVSADDEDFYRLAIYKTVEEDLYYEGSYTGHYSVSGGVFMETGGDPVLSDGAIGNSGGLFDFGSTNYFGAFSDAMFNGGSVTIRPEVKDNFDLWEYPYTAEEPFDRIVAVNKARVSLSHLPKSCYYYFKAANSLYEGTADLALEDVQIPDNIEGGIGYIGLVNSSSVEITFDSNEFDDISLYNDFSTLSTGGSFSRTRLSASSR